MAPKLIVVIGATGIQGGSVIDTFLKESSHDWTIRGLTRDVNSPAAKALKGRGVEMVAANLDDVSSLVAAFEGAHTIFSVINFWIPVFGPNHQSKLAPGQTILEWAHDYGLQQGKNVFDAAAQTQDLERVIFSALSYATKWSGGKYTHVYHFDSDARMIEYAELRHPDVMKKTSVIQIGMYLTNVLQMPNFQPKKEADGVYTFKTKYPIDFKLPMIAAEEDTGPLVKALLHVEPGKNLVAYREWMSLGEFVDLWGNIFGVKTRYDTVGHDEPWEGLPEELRVDIEESVEYITEFGFSGGDPTVVHPKDLGVPVHLDTVADWIKKQDWSVVM